MGGKSKQSQRTKNNVRPSNSGRSAQLLGTSLGVVSPLATSATGKAFPALFPTMATMDSEQSLNSDFSLCIKKLSKKDPVTKTKALQELTELVRKGEQDDVVVMLPIWTHLYNNLTVDVDHKVREATQVCHRVIAGRAGRALAPHLRRLLPAWLQAAHDSYPPAAAAADDALQKTFPGEKLAEAISFCKSELLAQLTENIVGDIETPMRSKGGTEESIVESCSRVRASALAGLAAVSDRAPPALRPWLVDSLAPLLADNAFWKLASHADPTLKSMWFAALCSMWSSLGGGTGAAAQSRAVKATLGALGAADATILARVWHALLIIAGNDKEWKVLIEKKKELSKRIHEYLSNGGAGASAIALPLLGQLPPEILDKEFYEQFFKALFTGLYRKSVITSKSERQNWITCVSECLRYLSIQDMEFSTEVATGAHRTWLEHVTGSQSEATVQTNLIKHSAINMTALVKFWLKKSSETSNQKYEQLIRNFWQNVASTIITQIDKLTPEPETVATSIENHMLLVKSLKSVKEPKVNKGIRFSDEPTNKESVTSNVVQSEQWEPAMLERYRHNVTKVGYQVCVHYLEYGQKQGIGSTLVPALMPMIEELESKELFTYMAESLASSADLHVLYDKVLGLWLASDCMRSRQLLEIVFVLMQYMTENVQRAVFKSFDQLPISVCVWAVRLSLSPRGGALSPSRSWLATAAAAGAIQVLCETDLDFLLANLMQPECVLPMAGRERVTARCREALRAGRGQGQGGAGQGQSGAAAAAAGRAARALALDLPQADLLMEDVFTLLLHNPPSPEFCCDTWREAASSCQDALQFLAKEKRDEYIAKFAQMLLTKLDDIKEDLKLTEIEHISSLTPYLIHNDDEDALKTVAQLAEDLSKYKNKTPNVEKYALRHDCIRSYLNCPFDEDNESIKWVVQNSGRNDQSELSKESFIVYAKRVLFRSLFVRDIFLKRDYEECEGKWRDAVSLSDFGVKLVADILYDYAIIQSLLEGYAFWPHYDLIDKCKSRLALLLEEVTQSLSTPALQKILTFVGKLARTEGYYWAYAIRHLRNMYALLPEEKQQEINSIDGEVQNDDVTGNGFFHSLQAETEEDDKSRSCAVMVRTFRLAHPGLAPIETNDISVALDTIIEAYYKHTNIMLYEVDVASKSWPRVLVVCAVADHLANLMKAGGKAWDAPNTHWDFTTITLCSLFTTLRKSRRSWGCTKVSMLCRAVSRLLITVQGFIAAVPRRCEFEKPSFHVSHLPYEWRDIFLPDLTTTLYRIVEHIADSQLSTQLSQPAASFIRSLCMCLPPCLPVGRVAVSALPHVSKLLSPAAHHAYKYLADGLITVLLPGIMKCDAEASKLWSEKAEACTEDEESEPVELSVLPLIPTLTHLLELAEAAVSSVEVCAGTVEAAARGAAWGVCSSALICARIVLRAAKLCPPQPAADHYVYLFRNQPELISSILSVTTRLLPSLEPEVLAQHQTWFTQHQKLDINEPPHSTTVARLACRTWALCWAGGGAAPARGWAGALTSRAAAALHRAARLALAPSVIKDMMDDAAIAGGMDGVEVLCHPSTGEIVATLTIEDRPLVLTITLAPSTPLVAPRVTTDVARHAHTLDMFLALRNGSMSECIRMWCELTSRRVLKSPACCVCYCRLARGGQLPRASCHTCHNRFHADCIRKWFLTSSKSSCPLCRSAF